VGARRVVQVGGGGDLEPREDGTGWRLHLDVGQSVGGRVEFRHQNRTDIRKSRFMPTFMRSDVSDKHDDGVDSELWTADSAAQPCDIGCVRAPAA